MVWLRRHIGLSFQIIILSSLKRMTLTKEEDADFHVKIFEEEIT